MPIAVEADAENQTEGSHWTQHARRWQYIGGPLRPSRADLEQVQRAVTRHFSPQMAPFQPARALLFGVTPELAELCLSFGFGVELAAFDQSAPMIAAVWPGDTEQRRAQVGDWCALDLPDASVSLAFGDGCFSTLDFPNGYRRFAASVARVLHSGALFSIRLFCRPAPSEAVAAVFDALRAGQIGNFHVFKWRLAMALQGDDPRSGVCLDAIWRAFQDAFPASGGGARFLTERLAWPSDEVSTIDNYRGSASAYTYSTVAEVVAALTPEFQLLEEWRGDYELGERCPQLLFRRR